MTSELTKLEITLMIESSEENLLSEAENEFGADNVSGSSNFIGGVSIAAFFVASIRSLEPTIKTILEFLSKRASRYHDARIVYDGKKVDLKGYSPEDAEKILTNSIFDKLRS